MDPIVAFPIVAFPLVSIDDFPPNEIMLPAGTSIIIEYGLLVNPTADADEDYAMRASNILAMLAFHNAVCVFNDDGTATVTFAHDTTRVLRVGVHVNYFRGPTLMFGITIEEDGRHVFRHDVCQCRICHRHCECNNDCIIAEHDNQQDDEEENEENCYCGCHSNPICNCTTYCHTHVYT